MSPAMSSPSEGVNEGSPEPRSPSAAERCRTLAATARTAALSTLARDPAGYPFGSLVAVAADPGGRLLLLLSALAEHTANLADRPEASILLTDAATSKEAFANLANEDPLARERVTLLGPCRRAPEGEADAAKAIFLEAHPSASQYAGFKDFAIYRLDPVALRYVGGFGRMAWVTAEEYRAAEPDPLAPSAAGILSHMNADHADTLLAYTRALAGVSEATAAVMTRVDRYGFEMRAATPGGERLLRLGFDAPASTTDEVRKAMIALARAARSKAAPSSP
ncbi:MAG TPA: DUF2470 domain-containing protein [Polyangiaceae bacterium]|nr:DUF2470 domain-containing protein [Polyangiaceae bacterium]